METDQLSKYNGPKILFVDLETSPILAHVWKLWQNDVGLNQIVVDWHLLSFSAKWAHDDRIFYMDQRGAKNIEDDRRILKRLWQLLNKADIIVTQNGKDFDEKRFNARFIALGFPPPSTYKHVDTCVIAKKKFGFTSNKLEYMAQKLGLKNKKLKHKKFPGHDLWRECLAGNKEAWEEMKTYNQQDVLVLEELYYKLMPWANETINFAHYHDDEERVCHCGSTEFQRRGYHYTQTGKFQRFKCVECGAWSRGRKNLIVEKRRKNLLVSPK